jgi:hypothetical protein
MRGGGGDDDEGVGSKGPASLSQYGAQSDNQCDALNWTFCLREG